MTDEELAVAVGQSLEAWMDESAMAGDGSHGPPTLIAAFSGGLDSCVLLHALRFGPLEVRPVAAHFDHRMRPGSRDDASWVRGLCRAWDVPLETGVRPKTPTTAGGDESDSPPDTLPRADDAPPVAEAISEAEARRLRYDFLHAVRRRHAPSLLLTAHHADDQAETVLFRILRGTGIDGLSGIPAVRAPGIVRPLLPFWRGELEAYARRHGLGWREDPTNREPGYARNFVRNRILPLAEEAVPGARRALVRLAEIAGEETEAWSEALERLEPSLDLRADDPAKVSVDRDALASLGPGLRARAVRHLVRAHLGSTAPDREATARAVEFAAEGRSHRRVELGSGVEMARELDRIEIRRMTGPGSEVGLESDREVVIERAAAGDGVARLGGSGYRVRWEACSDRPERGAGASPCRSGDDPTVVLPLEDLALPLRVRSRRPGDRMKTSAGTRKLKKILLEARVPARRRDQVPVLVDARGRVLWVPGVTRASRLPAADDASGDALRITIEPDEGAADVRMEDGHA